MKRRNAGRASRICLSLLAVVMLMATLCPASQADTDGTEPQITQQPDQLVLQLGTRWAGVEFELRTDAGVFPAPIVVDENGVLTMDLGGSTCMSLLQRLERAEAGATGVTAKGFQTIRMLMDGYTNREIGERFGVPANHVTAWVARARKVLSTRE